jgi:hypothetical protein
MGQKANSFETLWQIGSRGCLRRIPIPRSNFFGKFQKPWWPSVERQAKLLLRVCPSLLCVAASCLQLLVYTTSHKLGAKGQSSQKSQNLNNRFAIRVEPVSFHCRPQVETRTMKGYVPQSEVIQAVNQRKLHDSAQRPKKYPNKYKYKHICKYKYIYIYNPCPYQAHIWYTHNLPSTNRLW